MSRKVGVIGMGNVGPVVAHYLVDNGFCDDLVLIDKNKAKVQADALDFRDAMPNLPYHTNITVNDYGALRDADVVISALGNIKALLNPKYAKKADRFAEYPLNVPEVRKVATKLKASGFHGVLDVITNPCDIITALYQKVTGLPKNRVLGTGTLLDSARMKRAVGDHFHVDSRSVSGYNLGEYGNSQFTAWSTVKVLDHPVTELAKKENLDLESLNKAIRLGGFTVFKGKHCTQYGVATAAVRLANLVMSDAHTVVPVSNYQAKYGTYLSYPVVVGRTGVVGHVHLDLPDDEQNKLKASAGFIRKRAKELKEFKDLD